MVLDGHRCLDALGLVLSYLHALVGRDVGCVFDLVADDWLLVRGLERQFSRVKLHWRTLSFYNLHGRLDPTQILLQGLVDPALLLLLLAPLKDVRLRPALTFILCRVHLVLHHLTILFVNLSSMAVHLL